MAYSSASSSSDSSLEPTNQSTKSKKRKAPSLEDILHEFGPINEVSYTPFQIEQLQSAKALLPSTFPIQPHPYDYFTLFLTNNLLRTITTNTNRYANIHRIQVADEGMREWSDLLVEELYVFIGVIIYMGVHKEPQIEMYWNTDFNKGPLHSIPKHISLRRFEQIKRYCHISCPESDERNGYHLPSNKVWWYKVEPLASALQASFQRYYSPSSEVSIDELMVRCFGRYITPPFTPPFSPLFYTNLYTNSLGLYIHIRCQINQLSKAIRSTESLITDTYITSFKAHERRVYRIYFTDQDSLRRHASYEPLPSHFHDVVLQYI